MKNYIISLMLQRTSGGTLSFTQTQHGRKGDAITLDEAIGSAVREGMKMKPGFGVVSILWMNADDFDDCGDATDDVPGSDLTRAVNRRADSRGVTR